MSIVDGVCRCDICKQSISGTDLFIESAQKFEDDKHVCHKCVDDFKTRSGESKVVSYEQIEEYARENGNRLKKDKSTADSVLDDLLKAVD